ncbi:hypothetical protein BBV17_22450 [Cytobacillus oceanisediminis]|uniref:Uncharacterized protein n=1 Tax=Cytobacillus oceanisediminis TaxID=665099 RepID=A0ABX3CP91_9BACI|nr:hypothetical protein BBV17_22450 [Cytobacillus oceanisediminis]
MCEPQRHVFFCAIRKGIWIKILILASAIPARHLFDGSGNSQKRLVEPNPYLSRVGHVFFEKSSFDIFLTHWAFKV